MLHSDVLKVKKTAPRSFSRAVPPLAAEAAPVASVTYLPK
jgi:hypothetical protein